MKRFLEYARDRSSIALNETMADTESPFEDSVKEFLESRGFVVRTQVGCAEFRIDLAIVDPDHPGRYLLAIECDGRKYHTCPVARDRDRLRQQVLENMGWRDRIHRIWSTDWFHNPDSAKQKLIDAANNAKRMPCIGGCKSYNPIPNPKNSAADPIVRMKHDKQAENNAVQNQEEYRHCKYLKARITDQIYDSYPSELMKAVQQVVEIESPVHAEEVIRRIRVIKGVGRAGSRIRAALQKAINDAAKLGYIKKKGGFLWSADMCKPKARHRSGEFLVGAELIADEEIEEAIMSVLLSHYATEEQALARHAARLLGFHNVQEGTAKRFSKVLSGMLKKGRIRRNMNDMIEPVQSA